MKEKTRYIIIINIKTPTVERITECFPVIKKYLTGISGDEWKMIYASPDGATIACLFKTKLYAHKVITDLMGTSSSPPPGPCILRSGDSAIVTELAGDYSGIGFSQGWTWLQHH